MNATAQVTDCAHRTSYACAKCNCTHCMTCDQMTITDAIKTAVRWCRSCDPYGLGPHGKLDSIDALLENPVACVHKAQSFGGRAPQRGLMLQIATEFPLTNELRESAKIFERDAVAIARALRDTLPGGTFDRLVAELLRMKTSDLTVSRS